MTSTADERKQWTAAGSNTAAQNTYTSIKTALAGIERTRNVEIFLQGSYANSTNIRADSDVDIVVMTKSIYRGTTERLSAPTKAEYERLPTATFSSYDLRSDVTDALVSYYGAIRVHTKNKCIRVDRQDGYVDADVVPCIQHRWYKYNNSLTDFLEGIRISPRDGGDIVNFPKEHIANGIAKNAACLTRYKDTVRQMKRLRNRATDQGLLRDGIAPGFLLECMTYNVPNANFIADDSDRLLLVLGWLKDANKTNFKSCDEIHLLFQTDPGDFDVTTAQVILNALWEAYLVHAQLLDGRITNWHLLDDSRARRDLGMDDRRCDVTSVVATVACLGTVYGPDISSSIHALRSRNLAMVRPAASVTRRHRRSIRHL